MAKVAVWNQEEQTQGWFRAASMPVADRCIPWGIEFDAEMSDIDITRVLLGHSAMHAGLPVIRRPRNG